MASHLQLAFPPFTLILMIIEVEWLSHNLERIP